MGVAPATDKIGLLVKTVVWRGTFNAMFGKADRRDLVQSAWLGPPMDRQSLALPMLAFCNGLRMILGRR